MRFDSLASLPFILTGSTSVIIPLNTVRGSLNVTLSPALTDPTLANYKVFASVKGVFPSAWSAQANLASVTLLQVAALRSPNSGVLASALTGISVGAGDLTDVDVTTQNPHGADLGFNGHGHTTTGHPVTDPQHTHAVASLSFSGGALTVNVDWMIIHT